MPRRVTLTAATLKRIWLVPGVLNDTAAEHEMSRLRFEARLAYLDGRNAHSRKYHRQADIISKLLTKKRAADKAKGKAPIADDEGGDDRPEDRAV